MELVALISLSLLLAVRELLHFRTQQAWLAAMRAENERTQHERSQLITRIQDPVAGVAIAASEPVSPGPRPKLHTNENDERTELADQIDELLGQHLEP